MYYVLVHSCYKTPMHKNVMGKQKTGELEAGRQNIIAEKPFKSK